MEEEKETQCNNIQENSGKRFKWLSIQTSQDTLQDNPDWISRLPDSLLLHILSQLDIKEVAKTSILSKRWRYLWTSLSCLDFRYLENEGRIEKATFIGGFLFHHDESKVDKLFIEFEYEVKHAPLVDSWIQFAVTHKVKEFKLSLFDGEMPEELEFSSDYTLYKLPHSLFTCGSLTYLELCVCDLNLPATIQLNTLKTLCFEYIDLDPFAIEHITSNCPLLEDLHLKGCNQSVDLNICITNNSIKNLSITEYEDYEFDNGIITINAPNLISLQFFDCLPRTNYHVEQLRSLEIVDFCVGPDPYYFKHVLYGEEGYDFAPLLHNLCYAKEFRLNSWCIQALTAKEIRGLDRVSINATYIQLSLGLTKWALPGIAYLLQSASYLETLEICCFGLQEPELKEEFVKEYDFEEEDFWELWESDSSSILQNTKTIKISNFHSTFLVEDLEHWEKEIELVRFLLKRSKVLERMTVEISINNRNNMELIMAEVTSFPRVSPKAELFITCEQGSKIRQADIGWKDRA